MYFLCLCQPGWQGTICTENIDDCNDHWCQNNATCVDMVGDYRCDCLPGYGGPYCEIGSHGNNLHEIILEKYSHISFAVRTNWEHGLLQNRIEFRIFK